MKPIDQNWKRYFMDHNEGLGTTYERFVLHRYFQKIKSTHEIKAVLEAPSFGMTGVSGINSIWWALAGCQVSLVDHDEERIDLIRTLWQGCPVQPALFYSFDYTSLPFEDFSFDMSWNFAALGYIPDLEVFFKELTRVTQKVIFLCIPNRSNLFCLFRSSIAKKSALQDRRDYSPLSIIRLMNRLGWRLMETGYLDVPPWPDIAMSKEDMLRKIGLRALAMRLRNRNDSGICILDYYQGKNPNMESRLMRYDFLEELPDGVKKIWAHHRYFFFLPKEEFSQQPFEPSN